MTPPFIPILDLQADITAHWDEYMDAIASVLKGGRFILGPNVRALEIECAQYLGAKHAVAVNSGTDALVIGLRALGVGAGDEVITTAFTFMATASAIGQVGATAVMVDIDPVTLNIDPERVAAAITARTKVIVPVHLFGHSADMGPILDLAKSHGIAVLEDCAQAFGATHQGQFVGTLGNVGAYSFFPTKNLGAFGDAGIITTNDDGLNDLMRMLRAHGSKKKYHNEIMGYNSRLDEMQAAILRPKLSRIETSNSGRRRVAAQYGEALAGLPLTTPVQRPYAHHVYHQYTILLDEGIDRDAVRDAMHESQVGTMVYYPVPLHKLPVFEGLGLSLPECEKAARRVLSLPIWPELETGKVDRVVQSLKDALMA